MEKEGKTKTTNKKASAETETVIIPKEIDPEQYVVVRNGFRGKLVYKSARSGETFIWDEFGDEQEMTLRELKNAKNSNKKFFANNWFQFDEDWIVPYLGVGAFYKNAVKIDQFDSIFKKSPTELRKFLKSLSDGQKKSVAYRALELMANREIDSLKHIQILEEELGIELLEKG